MNTKLLNFLTRNFKEKKLIFMAPGGDTPAGGVEDQEAGVSRPVDTTEIRAEGATARAAAANITAVDIIRTPVLTINGDDGYEYEDGGSINNPKRGDVRGKQEGGQYKYETYDGTGWKSAIELAAAVVPDAAATAEKERLLAEAKTRLEAEKTKVTGEKAKVTQDILRTKVKEQLQNGDDQLKDGIAKIIIPDGFDAEIEADFKGITDKLSEADDLTDPAAIDTKIQEAETALQDLTPEKYIEDRSEAIDKHKPLLALFDRLKAIGSNDEGKHAKKVKDDIRAAIIEDLQKGDPTLEQIPDAIKSDFSEKLAIAFVADTIEVTPEDFQAAIRFYKLGQYRVLNETHPKFQKNKKILDKFVTAKKEGKLNGITFDFFGSTNNVDHGLTKDVAWHQEKAAALTKILELNTAGRLQVDPAMAQFIIDNKALIEQYTAAVTAGAGYTELVTANKDKFLKGGTIFDLALRLQRAAEFKRLVEDKSEPVKDEKYTDIFTADGKDKIELRHKDDKTDDAMSSGIKVGLAESVFTPPAAPDAQGGGTPADAPAGTPADADPNAATDAPEVQTNTDDHAYFIEPDGRLKVTFKDNTETVYTIKKPDNVRLMPSKSANDQYVTFKVGDDPGAWIEFDKDKVFRSEDFEDNVSNTYTATLDDSSKTITITATPKAATETPQQKATKLVEEAIRLEKEAQKKTEQREKDVLTRQAAEKLEEAKRIDPQNADAYRVRFITETVPGTGGADAGADAPAPAHDALEREDRETTAVLEEALEGANTEINEGIQKLEATIGTNNFFVAGALPDKIAEKRGYIKETFDEIRGYLKKARENITKKDFTKAKSDYQEAARIVEETLAKELKPNPAEAALSAESQAVIKELRDKVVAKKPKVEAAFTAKFAAAGALEKVSPAAAQ